MSAGSPNAGIGVARVSRARRALFINTAAAGAVALLVAPQRARADGNWDGDQVSLSQTRLWTAVPPGLNWGLDLVPTNAQSLVFGEFGDGSVDLQGGIHTHPNLRFDNWVTYTLFNGTLRLAPVGGSLIDVRESVDTTYGSPYFADGSNIQSTLNLVGATTIAFNGTTSGALRIGGAITGASTLTVISSTTGGHVHGVYLDNANAGFTGAVNIFGNSAVRLLGPGRPGTGPVQLFGGGLDVLSDNPLGETVNSSILGTLGTVRADHNYTANPNPAYNPGVVNGLGPINVDNPIFLGLTNDATATFTADNGYQFRSATLKLTNAGGFAAVGTRTVRVENGNRTSGYAGSTRLTSLNRLAEQVVELRIGSPGVPSYFDFDPLTPGGIPLTKDGTGVLVIDGDNQVSSTAPKRVLGGVMRFNNPVAYGTTTGVVGGPADPITLVGGGAPVSAGMGIAYPTPVPANMQTDGIVPGQSGAIDIDFLANPAPINLQILNTGLNFTGLRIGSSGIGQQIGPIIAYSTPAAGTNTYFLGGGGGILDIMAPLPAGPGPGVTFVEMGTTGNLLPGRVNLNANVGPTAGNVRIRAGTLGAAPPGILAATGGTSLGAYSTAIDSAATYIGAPAGTPYNGPGMLMLSAANQIGGLYNYAPGFTFGAAGLTLDGGAIGWDGNVPLPALPGRYGTPLASTLGQSTYGPLVAVPTSILHLGGEYSAGRMQVTFPITNNPITGGPVALLKSGTESILDLTALPANTYAGGTGIIGGEVLVSAPQQLSTGAVVIDDGARLHIVPSAAVQLYPQILRVANGIERRASLLEVDPGVDATFNGAFSPVGAPIEANTQGSVLEKVGKGTLRLYAPAVIPAMFAATAGSWGAKATEGELALNYLPGTVSPTNGQALFDGGTLHLISAGDPGGIPIPIGLAFNANYGFGALTSYAGTSSTLQIGKQAIFAIAGGQRGDWMGDVHVVMEPLSVFREGVGTTTVGDTRGTGSMNFDGRGFVQFNPIAGGPAMIPRDAGFTLKLNNGAQFSGCPQTTLPGNLIFNDSGAASVAFIDAATVNSVPVVTPTAWTIEGTGLTSWNSLVLKTQTEAIPGSGGPFTTGTVLFSRGKGAPVVVQPGSTLRIDFGTVNAGGLGDPFTDNSGLITTGNHVNVENNVSGGFNIIQGAKAVADLTVTGFNPGAPVLGGSSTSLAPSTALEANHVRQNTLTIQNNSKVTIRTNGGNSGVSRLNSLSIAGGIGAWTGTIDVKDNDILIDYTGATPFSTVRDQIIFARHGGLWDRPGITTSLAGVVLAGPPAVIGKIATLGYGEASAVGSPTVFDGQSIDNSTVIVKYTLVGDADLDGDADGVDIGTWATHFTGELGGAGTEVWTDGDWDYDGDVDGVDAGGWATNFTGELGGAGLGTTIFVDSPIKPGAMEILRGMGITVVPDPGTVGALGLLGATFLTRRRRVVTPTQTAH